MKIAAFIQTPYRDIAPDFDQRYPSAVTPPWRELAEPERAGQYYRYTLEELLAAARAGFDGVAMTEHGQNLYDMVPNPNLLMAALATMTDGLGTGLIVLGTSVGKSRQPLRIAEEYALLDCLSGGRLVAGLPLGLSYDANLNYGIPPIESRARYREAHDLIMRAWTADEPFPWNGKYWQFHAVNMWPRPIQQPHPPVWIPGSGSPGTMTWALDNDYCYVNLSWFGPIAVKAVVDRYWAFAHERSKDTNPYRFAFLQSVFVSETDAQAERDYAEHIEFWYRKCIGGIPPAWLGLPGYVDYYGLEYLMRHPGELGLASRLKELTYRELVDSRAVIAGSPATVRDQLKEAIADLRIGQLLVMLQMGSMPHELTLKNIDLLAREVLPHIRNTWDDMGVENDWWPTGQRSPAPVAAS
jgi:alkanesulfonate monooxygenase SsuD/methylene tetrahydromethanopterin reductase-like flavin-dependent oxidoreductase (luciferase family)